MIPLRDHADGFCSDSVSGVFGGEKLIPGPVRASGACIVGGDGKHGEAGLDHMEPDERLETSILPFVAGSGKYGLMILSCQFLQRNPYSI